MKVLPLGTKETHQSLVVGDKNGTVTCLTVKKKITNVSSSVSLNITICFNFHILFLAHICLQILWKEVLPGSTAVTAVTIGASNTDASPKVYVAAENKIYGMSKSVCIVLFLLHIPYFVVQKGKIFKELEMNFTDPLSEIVVDGQYIYTVQDYVHNVLVDGQEKYFFMSEGIASTSIISENNILSDLIRAMVTVLPGKTKSSPVVVLACQDKTIRVVRESNLLYECPLSSAPTALQKYVSLLFLWKERIMM